MMEKKYKGMTVNERLHVGGLFSDFEKAISDKDIERMTQILTEVELTAINIEPILKEYGLI